MFWLPSKIKRIINIYFKKNLFLYTLLFKSRYILWNNSHRFQISIQFVVKICDCEYLIAMKIIVRPKTENEWDAHATSSTCTSPIDFRYILFKIRYKKR